jgi:glutamate carboxypeptidase
MPFSPLEEQLCRNIEARFPKMVSDLAELVAMPTGFNNYRGLKSARDWFSRRFVLINAQNSTGGGGERPRWYGGPDALKNPRSLSAKPRPQDRAPVSLISRRFNREAAATVLLSGHLDTVFPPIGVFQHELVYSPDRKFATGPGCIDMKGGLVVALHALEALYELKVPVSWGFVLNCDEETGSFWSDSTLRREASTLADRKGNHRYSVGLVFEPAPENQTLVVERPGSAQFIVEVFGVPAHAGRDYLKGASAVHELARIITAIEEAAKPAEGLIVNFGPLMGADTTNIVADRAAAWGNMRYPNKEVGQRLTDFMLSLQRNGPTPADGKTPASCGVAIDIVFNRPAKPNTPAVSAFANFAMNLSAEFGQPLKPGKTGGVCDGNNIQAAGLPVIDTLGVRGSGMHTRNETIELASIVDRAKLAAVLISRLCAGELNDDLARLRLANPPSADQTESATPKLRLVGP